MYINSSKNKMENTDYKCEICFTVFKTKSSLSNHKRTAKYCLKIQNKENDKYNCKYCNKKFTTKYSLELHCINCSVKKAREINDLKTETKKIKEVEFKLIEQEKQHKLELKEQEIKYLKENIGIPKNIKNLKDDTTFKLLLENEEIIKIGIRKDGSINATELCKAAGKVLTDYQKNKYTKEYLQILSSTCDIPIEKLMETNKNNSNIYIHRKMAYNLAQWISPYFAIQISNVLDNFVIDKVDSDKEHDDIVYQNKINSLTKQLEFKNKKLQKYETTIFNRTTDICPIDYYSKDIVYFFKFEIPTHLISKYIYEYPTLDNQNYSCIEFGVSSDFEQRIKAHKSDRIKDNLLLLHIIEMNKRYTASKMEAYIKTIVKQMKIKFKYENKTECILINEEQFNMLINKINAGLNSIDNSINNNNDSCINSIYEQNDKNKNLDSEIQKLKIHSITDLLKNKIISFEDYTNILLKI